MKKGFLKSKIFLLVFTMGFLPEALAQSQCKDSFSFFYTKEVKAQLISDIEASQTKPLTYEYHVKHRLLYGVKTSNLIGIKGVLTDFPALAEEFPNLKSIPLLDHEMNKKDNDADPYLKKYARVNPSTDYTKEVKAQLISDIKASIKKHSADEAYEIEVKNNLIHDIKTSNFRGIQEILTKYPAWAKEFPNLTLQFHREELPMPSFFAI